MPDTNSADTSDLSSSLFIISFVAFLIILIVIGVNIYMLFLTRRDLQNQKQMVHQNTTRMQEVTDDMDVVLAKINSGVKYKIDSSAVSILDLAEFKDLDPYLKDAYKRYIVDSLSSAFMKAINKTMSQNDMKNYLRAHQNEMDDMAYAIAKKLQYGGLDALPQIYGASKPDK